MNSIGTKKEWVFWVKSVPQMMKESLKSQEKKLIKVPPLHDFHFFDEKKNSFHSKIC